MHNAITGAVNRAEKYHLEGFNCAEAVLLSIAEYFDIECPEIPKIATPFGGGIARGGSICGAVTGGLMALGLKFGRTTASDTNSRDKSYRKAAEFLNFFEKKYGTILCYILIGLDLRTPEGLERLKTIRSGKCMNYVKSATEIVIHLVESEQ